LCFRSVSCPGRRSLFPRSRAWRSSHESDPSVRCPNHAPFQKTGELI
jgi:hypothetical protein